MAARIKAAKRIKGEISSEGKKMLSKKEKARKHMEQLHRLQDKDPEFYKFLEEQDGGLLNFNDDEIIDEIETDDDDEDDEIDEELQEVEEEKEEKEESDVIQSEEEDEEVEEKSSKDIITSEMVDSWIKLIKENASLNALRSLMRAFRIACHYGDDDGDDSGSKFSVMSSNVFNKIMLFAMNEMDGILRGLLKLPSSGVKKETIMNLTKTKQWKNYNNLVKSYLGNALHVLNQMTDTQMISFTLRRLRNSSIFLAAFPVLLRKYIKVILHFWGTGGGALPVASFLFLRDLCMQFDSDCVDDCFKGMYKSYVQSCQYVNATKLQHIQFLGNCFTELLGTNLPKAYQHAFIFIRQLATILSQATTDKKKESFRKVYEWKYMNCLELWTGAICAYGSEADFKPLAYPLTQIISGAACLSPTAQYLPLRLRCARMLNRIAASSGTFIPVSLLLLDMLEMKELHKPPTGGVGKAIDLRTVLKVSKPSLKTRAFQETCVFSVVEEITEHLAQWSYSVAFYELSFVPAVRLRNFVKSTKIDRFRREMRELIRQIEANCEFTNKKRMSVTLLPNDSAAANILEDEKKFGSSPLSQYLATLHKRIQQRNASFMHSSMVVGEKSSVYGKEDDESDDEDDEDDNKEEEGAAVFSSSWLPKKNAKNENSKEEQKKKKEKKETREETVAFDEDVVEDFVLSDDDDDDEEEDDEEPSMEEEDKSRKVPGKQRTRKRKSSADSAKNKGKPKSNKRKRKN